jgi:hypothetical protein
MPGDSTVALTRSSRPLAQERPGVIDAVASSRPHGRNPLTHGARAPPPGVSPRPLRHRKARNPSDGFHYISFRRSREETPCADLH